MKSLPPSTARSFYVPLGVQELEIDPLTGAVPLAEQDSIQVRPIRIALPVQVLANTPDSL